MVLINLSIQELTTISKFTFAPADEQTDFALW